MEQIETDITNLISIGKTLEENGLNEYNNIDGIFSLYNIIEIINLNTIILINIIDINIPINTFG